MKQLRSLMLGLVAGSVAAAMVSSSFAAQTMMEGNAKVVRISGPARYTTGNNIWQPLRVGDVLKPGTIVQSGKENGCFIDLVLNDASSSIPRPAAYNPTTALMSSPYQPSASQNVVRIWQNSALGIDKLSAQQTGNEVVTDTQLDLRAGRVTGVVKKMSAASRYEIKLPNGVAGIRGTTFDITAEGVVKVYDGSVVIAIVSTDANGVQHTDTQVVNGGYQYDARTGKITELLPGERANFESIITELRYVVSGQPTVVINDQTINVQPSLSNGVIPPQGGPGLRR